MKVFINLSQPQHADPGRQMTVDSKYPGTLRTLSITIEMSYLAISMYTGIGSATTGDANGMIGNLFERCFNTTLNSRLLTLHLVHLFLLPSIRLS